MDELLGAWLAVSAQAAISAEALAALTPEEGEPAHCLPAGQQAFDVVGGDLFGDVAL